MKTCKKCKSAKNVSEFSKRTRSSDGLDNVCKPCKSFYAKEIRLKNIESYRAKERLKPSNKEYLFEYKHGFPREEALKILKTQGGCAICEKELNDVPKGWYVDHNHNCCGQNTSCEKCRRGILCRECNLLLGFAKDDELILSKAIDYLAKYKQGETKCQL